MCMTEKEERIVNYMAELVGTSLDTLDKSSKDMIKLNAGILTVLTTIAAYFGINTCYLIFPVSFISVGLLFFVISVQPIKNEYVVGEIDSSVNAYNIAIKRKHKFQKYGYWSTYLGFIWFIFVIVA